jgi:hypothetical protein
VPLVRSGGIRHGTVISSNRLFMAKLDARTDRPSHINASPLGFRIATLSFAFLLATYCIWLLSADLIRPPIGRLPVDPRSAASASEPRAAASLAASIGLFRGDLWSISAYTLPICCGTNDIAVSRHLCRPKARAAAFKPPFARRSGIAGASRPRPPQ